SCCGKPWTSWARRWWSRTTPLRPLRRTKSFFLADGEVHPALEDASAAQVATVMTQLCPMFRLVLAAARHHCDVSISDNGTAVTSSITVGGRTGDAPGGPGRLRVPPGELQFVGSADNANATCTVNACSEVANGT
ncbi:hypothetical protein ACFRLW_28830, partial [Streptomyces sp. NPDC056728]